MFILAKMVAHLLAVVSLKKQKKNYPSPSAWLAAYQAPKADTVRPYAATPSSSRLPNIVHASTLPAARHHTPFVLRIYS
jgi:hypothetical protein